MKKQIYLLFLVSVFWACNTELLCTYSMRSVTTKKYDYTGNLSRGGSVPKPPELLNYSISGKKADKTVKNRFAYLSYEDKNVVQQLEFKKKDIKIPTKNSKKEKEKAITQEELDKEQEYLMKKYQEKVKDIESKAKEEVAKIEKSFERSQEKDIYAGKKRLECLASQIDVYENIFGSLPKVEHLERDLIRESQCRRQRYVQKKDEYTKNIPTPPISKLSWKEIKKETMQVLEELSVFQRKYTSIIPESLNVKLKSLYNTVLHSYKNKENEYLYSIKNFYSKDIVITNSLEDVLRQSKELYDILSQSEIFSLEKYIYECIYKVLHGYIIDNKSNFLFFIANEIDSDTLNTVGLKRLIEITDKSISNVTVDHMNTLVEILLYKSRLENSLKTIGMRLEDFV